MGGTFMALSEEYRDYFIRNLHDALSGHTSDSVAEAVKLVHVFVFTLFVRDYPSFSSRNISVDVLKL